MAKEARYASIKLDSRMAGVDDYSGSFSLDVEMDKPMYLRKKREQGKRMDKRD